MQNALSQVNNDQETEGDFLIPVIALFTDTVLIRFPEEDEAGAKYAFHKGGFCFRMVINQRISVRTAMESGLNQLFISV